MTYRYAPRLVALLAGSALGLAACERNDPVARDLKAADALLIAMRAAVAGGGAPIGAARQKKTIDEALAKVRAHTGAELPGQAIAANIMQARLHAAMAEIIPELGESPTPAESEGQAQRALVAVRTSLNTWLVQSVRAAAIEKYDPSSELKALDALEAGLSADAAKNSELARGLEASINALRAESDRLLADGKSIRNRAAEVRAGASKVSAVAGLALFEEAAALSRQADALELKAAEKRTEADGIAPKLAASKARAAELAAQLDEARQARARVQQKSQLAATEGRAARSVAADAAEALKRDLAEMEKARTAAVEARKAQLAEYDKAKGAANKAVSAAKGDNKAAQSLRLTVAGYEHARADILLATARELETYARLLTELGAAQPPLAESAAYSKAAEEAAASAKSQTEEARAAYVAAAEGYEKSGGGSGGDAPDRLARVVKMLNDLGGKAPEAGSAEPEKAAPTTAAAPAAAGGDAVTEIRAVLVQLRTITKSAKIAELPPLLEPSLRPEIEALVKAMGGLLDLDAACKEKFGKSLTEHQAATGGAAAAMGGAAMMPGAEMLGEFDPATVEITLQGANAAVVKVPPPGMPLNLVRIDGKWLVARGADAPAASAEQLAMMGAMMAPMNDAASKIAGEVRSGKITSIEAAMSAFEAAMANSMEGMLKGLMPKGGGGGG